MPAPLKETPAIQEAPKPAAKPVRFVHENAFQVFILTPFDKFFAQRAKDELADELSFLEYPPQFINELTREQAVPGTVIYVAIYGVVREKTKSGRYQESKKLIVTEPIEVSKFYGTHKKNGALNMEQLGLHIGNVIKTDPFCWLVRPSSDGGIKIFDN